MQYVEKCEGYNSKRQDVLLSLARDCRLAGMVLATWGVMNLINEAGPAEVQGLFICAGAAYAASGTCYTARLTDKAIQWVCKKRKARN